jgi:flagellar protein FliS
VYTDPKQAYVSTFATSSIHDASPHKLVSLLLDATLAKLAVAKGAMERKDVKVKAEAVKRAMDIIVSLQACLDHEAGGDIAQKLDDLYTFSINRLSLANATNDTFMINDVVRVIGEIRQGWEDIKGVGQ